MSLGVAALLWLRLRSDLVERHLLWAAAALISMGLIDGIHGALPFGAAWSWTRHVATLAGGLFFAAVWLPIGESLWARRWMFVGAILIASTIGAMLVWYFATSLPVPITPEGFTFWPKLVNAIGGLGFVTSSLFFFRRYARTSSRDDLVFAGHTLLFGACAFLFSISSLWNAEFWLWHFLRLAAYLIVVRAAYISISEQTVEIVERQASLAAQVEQRTTELRVNQTQLEAELANMHQLQIVSAELLREDIRNLYEKIVDAAVTVMRADYASIQMLDDGPGGPGELRLIAFRGFNPQAARFWEWVRPESNSTCGKALRDRERIVVSDVASCDFMTGTDDLATYQQTGIRAVQTTPLVSRGGGVVGMISTHWKERTQPSDSDLRVLDVLARQAADLVERKVAGDALQASDRLHRLLAEVGELASLFPEADDLVEAITTRMAGELGVSKCGLSVVDQDAAHFAADGLAGRTTIIADLAADARTRGSYEATFAPSGVRAHINVPLRRDGKWAANFWVSHSEPRAWMKTEVELVELTAERVWAAVERKLLEQQRNDLLANEQASRSQAESANRLKDEFLATLSHELRTPLNAILGWATMLRSVQLDQPTFTRGLDTIERCARSQSELIEDLLDVSRITSGKLLLEVRPTELIPVVNQAIDAVRITADLKEMHIEATFDATANRIVGDRARLQQVVWNLLSNAIKFTGRHGTIRVRLERIDGDAQISVADTGEGISPEFLPHVFDRFRQADGTKTRVHGGLGLGLAITRHLVEAHGGSIEARSAGSGKGSTFVVRLPVATESTATVENPAVIPWPNFIGPM